VTQRAKAGDETGSLTLWLLGLCVILLFLGGLSLDLWRAFSERRALSASVDAAAVAGASGIDEQALRAGGAVRLDPAAARRRARASLADGSYTPSEATVTIAGDGSSVTVRAADSIDLTLLRVLLADEALEIAASATSSPEVGTP
jgi:Flp pilus assembly protein TadG